MARSFGSYGIVPDMEQTTGTVREWRAEEGWGVVDSADTPGGCWVHFSAVDGSGFRALIVGSNVDLGWEAVTDQDGYKFRATRVKQLAT